MGERARRGLGDGERSLLSSLFSEFQEPDLAHRFRSAAAAPLGAFIAAQVCDALTPLLSVVPPVLFYAVVLLLGAGASFGFGAALALTLRRRRELSGRAIAWLIPLLAISGLSAASFARMMPWQF